MIIAKEKEGRSFDIVVPDKKQGIADIVPYLESTVELDDLAAFIQSDREVSLLGSVPYTITSGLQLSIGEARGAFLADYDCKSPIKEGRLYWRTKPALFTFSDQTGFKYEITCRFSIV